jgi:hypothetical protein
MLEESSASVGEQKEAAVGRITVKPGSVPRRDAGDTSNRVDGARVRRAGTRDDEETERAPRPRSAVMSLVEGTGVHSVARITGNASDRIGEEARRLERPFAPSPWPCSST